MCSIILFLCVKKYIICNSLCIVVKLWCDLYYLIVKLTGHNDTKILNSYDLASSQVDASHGTPN